MDENTKAPTASLLEKLEARLATVRVHKEQCLANLNVAIGQIHEIESLLKDLRDIVPVAPTLPAPRLAPLKLPAADPEAVKS